MKSSLSRAWPYLFAGLAPLILFAPFLLGQRVLYWGTPLLQFYPWRQFALDTIRAGHLPLWNPYLGNGAPLIANYQSAIFYPPNWLSLILPLDYALSWLVVLHLVWAGAGMVTLARALGLRPLGQVMAGLAFGMSQYLVARLGFLSINAAAAWLPWVIWGGEQIVGQKPEVTRSGQKWAQAKHALLLSLLLSFQLLAGHAQTTWYTLILLVAWVLWRTLTQPPARGRARAAALFLLPTACLFAVALAALQLLPTAELLLQSPRAASADYEFVMTYSFSPWRLLTLLAPDVLGNPARGQFYGYGNYWEDAVYVGVLPLLLALVLVVSTVYSVLRRLILRSPAPPNFHPYTPLVSILTAVLLVALLLALGRNTPVFPFFYRYVPSFNLFQAPTRMMLWFVFALALLAGLGADRWSAPQGRALYWTRLGAAGAVAVMCVGVGALLVMPATTKIALQLRTVAQAAALSGVALFLSALLSLLKPAREAAHTHWELVAATFLAADLIAASYGLNPGGPPDLYHAPTTSGAALKAAVGEHRLFYFPADEHSAKFDRLLSFQAYGPPEWAHAMREAQLPNAALLDGLASANNFEPLVSARYAGLLDVISATHSLNLLRLMDVGVVASSASLDWEVVGEEAVSGVRFYRLPAEPQRVWIVYQSRTVSSAEAARAAIAAPDFDPAAVVILEASTPTASLPFPHTLSLPLPPTTTAPRTSLTPSPNAVTIPVSLRQRGWVVLADTYYPGWVAYVDGQPAPLLAANYAFRAAPVQQGEHVVEFRYAPRSFQIGSWISALGWLIWLVTAGWVFTRGRGAM
jgi:hypothetical protein